MSTLLRFLPVYTAGRSFRLSSPAGKWARVRTWSLMVALFFFAVWLFLAGVFTRIDTSEFDFERFLGFYFKDAFLLQMVILVAWYIAAVRATPERRGEFKFLNSLPLAPNQLFLRFFISDLMRFIWLPACFAVLLLGLLPVSSLAFLARPILFAFSSYSLAIALLTLLHLSVLPKAAAGKSGYLTKFNPLLVGGTAVLFESLQLLFVAGSFGLSAAECVALLVSPALIGGALMVPAARMFRRLQKQNTWLIASAPAGAAGQPRPSRFAGLAARVLPPSLHNPWLLKNVLLIARSRTKLGSAVLTGGLVSLAYVMAMNNRSLADAASVLYWMLLMFTVLYSASTMNRLCSEWESTGIVHALPVSRTQFYFSVFVPTLGWVALVITIVTLLLLLAGAGAAAAGLFWLRTGAATGLIVLLALNCAVASYPDRNLAKSRFGRWLFLLVLACAAFYMFRLPIVLLFVLLSFFQLRKLKFYNVRPLQMNRPGIV